MVEVIAPAFFILHDEEFGYSPTIYSPVRFSSYTSIWACSVACCPLPFFTNIVRPPRRGSSFRFVSTIMLLCFSLQKYYLFLLFANVFRLNFLFFIITITRRMAFLFEIVDIFLPHRSAERMVRHADSFISGKFG